MLSGQLSWARQNKTFDFYAGLPVSRTVLILAAVAVSVLFSLPGRILLTLLSMWIFHLALTPSPLVVVPRISLRSRLRPRAIPIPSAMS